MIARIAFCKALLLSMPGYFLKDPGKTRIRIEPQLGLRFKGIALAWVP